MVYTTKKLVPLQEKKVVTNNKKECNCGEVDVLYIFTPFLLIYLKK